MSFKNILIFFIVILLTNCQNNKNTFTPKADTDNGGLILPDGFGAIVVVDSVGASRHLAVNSNGDIYIKLSTPKGRKGNVALRDTDNDGKADIIKRFGNYPNDGRFATEMRIHKGYLYFSSELVVYRQKLTPGKLIPEGKPQVLVRDPFPIRWHNAKSLAFDNKGGMYVTFSAPTNACENGIMKGPDNIDIVKGEKPCSQLKILAGVWRFYEDRPNQSLKSGKRYATGLRSLVGITWNDNDNSLYAVNHGRDYLHNHAPQFYSEWRNAILPSEEFIKIKEGENYGWPYTYYDHFKHKRMLAPEYGGDSETEAKGYADPIMGLPAHWAPNDLLFYKGNQFPERYKKGAFIAFHGSFNRNPYPQAGYVVVFVPFKNGKPIGTYEIFADGFIGKDTIATMSESKYRPMGLAEGPDGSLYISDSKKGKIWRVVFKGDRSKFGMQQLAKMEKRKSKSHLKIPVEFKDKIPLKKNNK